MIFRELKSIIRCHKQPLFGHHTVYLSARILFVDLNNREFLLIKLQKASSTTKPFVSSCTERRTCYIYSSVQVPTLHQHELNWCQALCCLWLTDWLIIAVLLFVSTCYSPVCLLTPYGTQFIVYVTDSFLSLRFYVLDAHWLCLWIIL